MRCGFDGWCESPTLLCFTAQQIHLSGDAVDISVAMNALQIKLMDCGEDSSAESMGVYRAGSSDVSGMKLTDWIWACGGLIVCDEEPQLPACPGRH